MQNSLELCIKFFFEIIFDYLQEFVSSEESTYVRKEH